MKNKKSDFKVIKENPKNDNTNYIFKNDEITRTGFYIVATTLVIGVIMVVFFGIII